MLHLNNFRIPNCLNVLEYTIRNQSKLKDQSGKIEAMYKAPKSAKVEEILKSEILRPSEVEELKREYSYNYYYQYDQFHFIRTDRDGKKFPSLSFDDVVDFHTVNDKTFIVLTENDVINVIDIDNQILSYTIDNALKAYIPLIFKLIGNNKLFISFHWMTNQGERVLLYHLEKKILIQDIDALLLR